MGGSIGSGIRARGVAGVAPLLEHADDPFIDMSEWRELATDPLEPTVCQGPNWLGGMMTVEGLAGMPRLLVHRNRTRPVALLAVDDNPLPLPIVHSWHGDLAFSGLPLIDASDPEDALVGLLETVRAETGAKAVIFGNVPQSGPFAGALARVALARNLPTYSFDAHRRAALTVGGDPYETWFNGNFTRKRRKEYRRLKNRLAETGTLSVESWSRGDPLDAWTDEFLALEASGWKGRRGSALASSPAVGTAIAGSLGRLAESGRLMFWRLRLDGRSVAMLFAMISGNQAWLGKIAHDEEFARFSPGVLLILEATRDLLARADLARVDSCAIPDHPMIDNIWRDRITIADLMIATPGTSSLAFDALAGIERARRAARRSAKSVYHMVRKGTSR